MRVLLNCTLLASIVARVAGQVPSVGLWKKNLFDDSVCFSWCQRSKRAKDLRPAWLQELVLQRFKSQQWKWCLGSCTITAKSFTGGYQALILSVLVELVWTQCIMARECENCGTYHYQKGNAPCGMKVPAFLETFADVHG